MKIENIAHFIFENAKKRNFACYASVNLLFSMEKSYYIECQRRNLKYSFSITNKNLIIYTNSNSENDYLYEYTIPLYELSKGKLQSIVIAFFN